MSDASPEIVGNKEYVGPEVDIWSLGVLLYAMTTGRHPFHGNDDHVRRSIQRGTFVVPPFFSAGLTELLQGCLNVDRKQRFTIDQVVVHPWLASVVDDWKVATNNKEVDLPDGDSSSGSEGEERASTKRKQGRRFSFSRSPSKAKSNEDMINMMPSPSSSPMHPNSVLSSSPDKHEAKRKRKDSKG